MSLALAQLRTLPLARYEFRLRAREDTLLPTFLGSTLRGSFGHALKAIACSVQHQVCQRCLLTEACLYPNIFEPSVIHTNGDIQKSQEPPRPFLFQPPLPHMVDSASTMANSQRVWRAKHIPLLSGARLSFGMTLIGPTITKLPYIVYAVELMAQHGFGFARVPFKLEEVLIVNERNENFTIYTPQNKEPQMTRITPHQTEVKTLYDLVAWRLTQLDMQDTLTLLFITPTWVEIKKESLKSINCEQLVKRLSWRIARLFELYGDAPLIYDHKALIAQAATVETTSEHLWTHHFERYSNRRHDKTPMQGFLGEITYRGAPLKELLPLIIAGEFLQLGKETAFGLGRYWSLG